MNLRNTTLALCCGMAFAGGASAAPLAISLPGSSNGPLGVLLENKLPNLELAKSFTLLPGLTVGFSARHRRRAVPASDQPVTDHADDYVAGSWQDSEAFTLGWAAAVRQPALHFSLAGTQKN